MLTQTLLIIIRFLHLLRRTGIIIDEAKYNQWLKIVESKTAWWATKHCARWLNFNASATGRCIRRRKKTVGSAFRTGIQSAARLRRQLHETEREIERLEEKPREWKQNALHYTYIQEFYLTVSPRPAKSLFDLLEDYFILTDAGSWRPPQTEEEREAKATGRNSSMRFAINRYCRALNATETGGAISVAQPNAATLAEWIRYCQRSGLFAQGKLLYEKGGLVTDELSEMAQINIEEDYGICVRRLAQSLGEAKNGNKSKWTRN